MKVRCTKCNPCARDKGELIIKLLAVKALRIRDLIGKLNMVVGGDLFETKGFETKGVESSCSEFKCSGSNWSEHILPVINIYTNMKDGKCLSVIQNMPKTNYKKHRPLSRPSEAHMLILFFDSIRRSSIEYCRVRVEAPH